MTGLLRVSVLVAFVSSCASTEKSSETGTRPADSDDSAHTAPADEPPESTVAATALFDVTGGPYDLALAPDGRLFVSIEESRIDVWDPTTEWVEEHTRRAGSVFGIEWHGEHLYYTTSNHRQSGALLRLDGRDGTVLATASGSTIFREPTDLAVAPDGDWVIPDPTVGTLFVTAPDGTNVRMMNAGVTEPSSVACDMEAVYVGGIDGVARIPWPDGSPEVIDDRPVNGLYIRGESVLAGGPEWAVFEVGSQSAGMGGSEIRMAGRLIGDETIYVADWGGATVWAIQP